MNYKKILLTSMVVTCIFSNSASAQAQTFSDKTPILMNPSKGVPLDLITEEEKRNAQGAKPLSTKIQHNKNLHTKKVYKKAPANISELIEGNDFETAKKILRKKLNKNPKDMKSRALWIVVLAKQCSLDEAQKQLNYYLPRCPKNANLHYAQGIVYFKRTTSSNMVYISNKHKLFEQSYDEFQKAIELDPKNAQFKNAAGVVALNLGKVDESQTHFEKALELDKKYSTAMDNLGTIDYMRGDKEAAKEKFEKAIEFETSNTTAMYHLAQLAKDNKDYASAVRYLNNALYLCPHSHAIYNLFGEVYNLQGNQAAAINSFKKSIGLKPEFPYPYLNLAQIYEKRGDFEFATEQLRTVISVNPDFYAAKLKVADISLSTGKYPQAIGAYSDLIGVEGFNEDALKGLANSYFAQAENCATKSMLGSNKKFYQALGYIDKAISANPEDLELHLAKLRLLRVTKQPQRTNEELLKIISMPETTVSSNIVKGEAYLAMNDLKNANKEFKKAILKSKGKEQDLYLAQIFTYHRQYERAKEVLLKIMLDNPKDAQAQSELDYIDLCQKQAKYLLDSAKFYKKAKNESLAINYLARSLALEPNNAEAHLLLAQVYEKQKRYAGAIKNYATYLELSKNLSTKETAKITSRLNKLEEHSKSFNRATKSILKLF